MTAYVKLDIEDTNRVHHILIFTKKQFERAKMRGYLKPDKWKEAHYYLQR